MGMCQERYCNFVKCFNLHKDLIKYIALDMLTFI